MCAHVSIEYINYIIEDVDNAGQIVDMVHHVTTLTMGFWYRSCICFVNNNIECMGTTSGYSNSKSQVRSYQFISQYFVTVHNLLMLTDILTSTGSLSLVYIAQ